LDAKAGKRINLLSDTECAENQIQNVVGGCGSSDFVERTKRAVEVQQEHLVRNTILGRDICGLQACE
jgi:hypothetical protein